MHVYMYCVLCEVFISVLDTIPTMKELISFPTEAGRANLAEMIGVDYKNFGIMLLDDENGDRVEAIILEQDKNAAGINCQLFISWLDGKGWKPVTWGTFVTALQSIERKDLVNKVKNNLYRIYCEKLEQDENKQESEFISEYDSKG